jgi:2-polyprenyl-6-methoxyphenol hydroxylase-like FAD-dependent oxidoreductase
MIPTLDADVIIIGAGPVGLCLAMDLEKRGVSVLTLEQRHFMEPPSVKCNHIAARTMEQFRRLGFVKAIRSVGLTQAFPNDIAFRTTMTGTEIGRIHIPGRATRYTDKSSPDGWWPTPEPPHRSNQIYFEPVLLQQAAQRPGIQIRNRVEALSVSQHASGVEVVARDLDSGVSQTYRAKFLVGCEGGKSMVRKSMGANFVGEGIVQPTQSTYIRAPGLLERMGAPAWCNYAMNPRRCGTVFAIDGRETWLVHNYLNPDETDITAIDRDASVRSILGVDDDFAYEVLAQEDWIGRRLVSDKFRQERFFICGDAAHLWVPYAGYGMNAGIADAMNLSMHLASYLNGWADETVLDAYERERQPITEQVSHFAMNHAASMMKARIATHPQIEDDSLEGDAIRRRTAAAAYELNVQQYCCAGLNFGYFYDNSSLIAYDDEAPPSYTMGSFTASTVPGCRTPHFWLRDGRSLYDALGPDYTLLVFDAGADVSALVNAAALHGMPLTVVDVSSEEFPPEYRKKLLLCRGDQHVAWRGDSIPHDAPALVRHLSGHARHHSRGELSIR